LLRGIIAGNQLLAQARVTHRGSEVQRSALSVPPRLRGNVILSLSAEHAVRSVLVSLERSPVATVRFPLRASAFGSPAQTNDLVTRLLARVTDWDLPGRAPGTSSMIVPGAPDLSVLLVRMRSRRPSTQMPPLGTVVPDREALELIASWIASM